MPFLWLFGTSFGVRIRLYYPSIMDKKEYSALVAAASGVIVFVAVFGFAIYKLVCRLRGVA